MLLESVQLVLEELCRLLGLWEVCKGLGELVHSPPHVALVLLHLLSIQLYEGPWKRKQMGRGGGYRRGTLVGGSV